MEGREEKEGRAKAGGDDSGRTSTAEAQGVSAEGRLRARIAELEEENDVLALCATEVNR